jgi:hypothetical protein
MPERFFHELGPVFDIDQDIYYFRVVGMEFQAENH